MRYRFTALILSSIVNLAKRKTPPNVRLCLIFGVHFKKGCLFYFSGILYNITKIYKSRRSLNKLELHIIQSTIKELESSSFNINNIITSVLRIAQQRFDIEELLFFKLLRIKITSEGNKGVFEDVKKIAFRKRMSVEEYEQLCNKVYLLTLEVRKTNWYDEKSQKMINDRIIPYTISEIILDLDHHQSLLEDNKVPEGLASLDAFYANESKQKLDNALYNHIFNYKTILNRIKDRLMDYLFNVENEMLQEKEIDIMDVKTELQLLIQEGYTVKQKCYVRSNGEFYGDYISGEDYVAWLQKCKIFIKKNINDREIYDEFADQANNADGNGQDVFRKLIGTLKALEFYEFSEETEVEISNLNNKIDKIFISHSSKDVEYVKLLVQLLNDIGIKKSEEHIFCSSLPGYSIPYGESIYEYLKKELNSSNIMVLFVLSHNYYQSAPCLNEMGAAWISSKNYNSLLTPNFDFRQMTGAIDLTKISLYINDENGLNKFKDKLVEILKLEDVNYQIWGEDRKKFIESVNKIALLEASNLNTQVQIERVNTTGAGIELQLRFVNVTDKDIEFKYIDFELVDSNGNKITLSAEDDILKEFRLYSRENKVVKWLFDYEGGYNPRRDNNNLSKVSLEIYN